MLSFSSRFFSWGGGGGEEEGGMLPHDTDKFMLKKDREKGKIEYMLQKVFLVTDFKVGHLFLEHVFIKDKFDEVLGNLIQCARLHSFTLQSCQLWKKVLEQTEHSTLFIYIKYYLTVVEIGDRAIPNWNVLYDIKFCNAQKSNGSYVL